MTDQEHTIVYESPDGGKTIYARKSGDPQRVLIHMDELYKKELELTERWKKLKKAVFLDDPGINDLISKIEVLMELKR